MNQELLKFLSENKDAVIAFAAIGALVMSAITALLSAYSALRTKMIDVDMKRQDAVRKLVEADMVVMGEAMHETLARATILVKKFGLTAPPNTTNLEESIVNYKKKIDESKKVLIHAKTAYRYKFHGLESGLTAIARAADWIKGLKNNPDFAKLILEQAAAISVQIDKAIVRAYRDGKHPTRVIQLKIQYRVWKIHRMWEIHKNESKNGNA